MSGSEYKRDGIHPRSRCFFRRRALFILFYIFISLFMTKPNETRLQRYTIIIIIIIITRKATRARYFVRSKKINETMTAAAIRRIIYNIHYMHAVCIHARVGVL